MPNEQIFFPRLLLNLKVSFILLLSITGVISFLTFNYSCVFNDENIEQAEYSSNAYAVAVSSNDHVVYYDSNHFTSYQFITNLTNYNYFVEYISNIDIVFLSDHTNEITKSNFSVETNTNYYFTNTLVTNYSVINSELSTNNNLIDCEISLATNISANNIVGYTPYSYITTNNITFTNLSNNSFSLYPNGNVKFGFLNSNRTINGVSYKYHNGIWNASITFYQNGQVNNGYLNQKFTLNGITAKSNRYIAFYENGAFKELSLATNTTIQGLVLSNHIVSFYENGNLKQGQIAGYPGNYIRLNIDGTTNSMSSNWDFNF